ncbi:MAG TPA: hypothetical protein VHT03_05325 [Rhizomicrobium sp.]|nr:hypothetical protein [Rhizomicrobium sp.]
MECEPLAGLIRHQLTQPRRDAEDHQPTRYQENNGLRGNRQTSEELRETLNERRQLNL